MVDIRKSIRLTENQASNWDPDKVRDYLDSGCQTKTKIVRQDVRQEYSFSFKTQWPEFRKSVNSIFKKWPKLNVIWKVIKTEVEANMK